MAEKELEKRIDVVDNQEGTDTENLDYISAIREMKKNSVDRSQYERLKVENKQLLDALIQGKEIEVEKAEPVDVDELRKKLFNRDGNLTNLEYVSTALQLRDALIAKGERDPFLPSGDRVTLTAEHYEKAEAVAQGLKECVEFADGDSGIFNAEYQRRTKDTMPIKNIRR